MRNTFTILRDLLDEPSPAVARFDAHTEWTPEALEAAYPVRFKLYDDDGELYFCGRAVSVDAVEDAHDWGTWYAGTTTSRYMDDRGAWQPFIGYGKT